MEDTLSPQSHRQAAVSCQSSEENLDHLFNHQRYYPFNEELNIPFAPDGALEESQDFTSTALNFESFMTIDPLEGYQDYGNVSESHINGNESYHVPPNFPPPPEENIASPNSSRHSDDSHNIIPEHYGPGYWLSVCSSPGLTWVRQRVGMDDFEGIAAELTASWMKQLRLERNEPTLRSAEPESELAWKYSNAYFERSADSIFDVVQRHEFEHHLRTHLNLRYHGEDPTWYALRNAVFASGCRLYHSEDHAASFTDIQEEAWSYFSNSLSVHSELLLRSPSLRAVRALLAMALFAEGLGSPALGSGLSANAALVAQSLGLHRKLPNDQRQLDSISSQRIWLFWAVYCCEKNIAQRAGRPSIILDDDIGCSIPNEVHPGSTMDVNMFKYIIRSCQVSSRICKGLMSSKALEEKPSKLLKIMAEFDMQIQEWKDSLPVEVKPKDKLTQFQISPDRRSLAKILLHCSYYDLLMVIHTLFAYPWATNRFNRDLNPDLRAKIRAQITSSLEIMVTAARNLIVIARNFDINGTNTYAFMLHFPMHAFINLFIYVIMFPEKQSVRSDLALLDVAAGYFGQMDFVTGSKLSFPFARDIAALGRKTVENTSRAT